MDEQKVRCQNGFTYTISSASR